MKKIKIAENFYFSNNSEIKFILGPCQIESKQHAFDICYEIERLSKKFKSRKNIDITKPSIIIIDKTDELYEKISINENLYCKIYSKQIYEVFIKQNLKKC